MDGWMDGWLLVVEYCIYCLSISCYWYIVVYKLFFVFCYFLAVDISLLLFFGTALQSILINSRTLIYLFRKLQVFLFLEAS